MKTKCHFVTLALVVLLSTSTFAQTISQWIYGAMPGPAGPPSVSSGIALPAAGLVFKIDQPQQLSYVGGYCTQLCSLIVCAYSDRASGPVWQGAYTAAAIGQFTMNPGLTVQMPPNWYVFYAGTGGVAGFLNNQYPDYVMAVNAVETYWGTTGNYVKGSGACPATLGQLTPVPAKGQPDLPSLQMHY